MAISFHTRLESETIYLPQAAELVGKEVRITIVEEPSTFAQKDMSKLEELAGKINLDWDALDDLRRASLI